MTTTHTLETAEADIAYDVHGPLHTDGRPPLVMIGQPMTAGGFGRLASLFLERTVVTYDPRGLGSSTRKDGRVDNAPTVQADDVHAVVPGSSPAEGFDAVARRQQALWDQGAQPIGERGGSWGSPPGSY